MIYILIDILLNRQSRRRQLQLELAGTVILLLPFAVMVLLVMTLGGQSQ